MIAGWLTGEKFGLALKWVGKGIPLVWLCSGGCKIGVCIYMSLR